ncbi:hypothetical protein Q4Q35_12555 [Flavivirga aquimarina]|uniref:DUF3575 domain-containing protein n=1 Tax=Flavivirga aquimarina TaxID=2027862 RepID=A0ABT8WBZ8_9FLAO|nr:hypothetical protein [Flavivirga aquimarina]MDO5970640.1 hypothetical protein [Flavivirga aquimarina]
MRKILLGLLLVSSIVNVNAQFITKDYTQISVYIDPTITDNGFQIGGEIQKIMHWGYASIGASTYNGFIVSYTDLIGTLGINFNLFNNDVVRYYNGFRLGLIWRETSPFPAVGGVLGFDIRLSKFYSKPQILIGARLWTDYREDQKNQFYGDSNGYKKGLITNNPLLQENGAIVVSMSW